MLHPRQNITATSLQRLLWFVSKVAVVEKFDCIYYKKLQLVEFQCLSMVDTHCIHHMTQTLAYLLMVWWRPGVVSRGEVSDTFTQLGLGFQRKITFILTVWLGTLPKLFLFEGSVSIQGPAGETYTTQMCDWPIPWQGGWSGPLESLVCLDLFAGMILQARSGLRYIHSFIYSRFAEADQASSNKSTKAWQCAEKVDKKERKQEFEKFAFSEIRLFLENQMLEFNESLARKYFRK